MAVGNSIGQSPLVTPRGFLECPRTLLSSGTATGKETLTETFPFLILFSGLVAEDVSTGAGRISEQCFGTHDEVSGEVKIGVSLK